jgi:hypothetical protein
MRTSLQTERRKIRRVLKCHSALEEIWSASKEEKTGKERERERERERVRIEQKRPIKKLLAKKSMDS